MKHSLNNNPIHPIRVLRRLLLALGLFLLLVLLSVTVPYAFDHPQVSEDYIHWVAETDFTDTTSGIDRVRLLTENEAALEERIRLISQAEERIIYVTFDFRADSSGKDVMALLLEAAERYVMLGVLVFTAPVAFASGASENTSNVFSAWCRMLGGQLFLLIMNAWCLRLFVSMVGTFIANPLSL